MDKENIKHDELEGENISESGAPDTDGKPDTDGGNRAFTQADIDAAVKAAIEKNNKSVEARIDAARKEAERLARMDEQERQDEERRIELENFKKEKADFEAEKLKIFAERKLQAAGLPVALAATVAAGDRETTQANITALAETFNNAVAGGVKAKLAGKAPRGGAGETTESDRDKMKADIEKAMKRGF